jgi:hypothetical protein
MGELVRHWQQPFKQIMANALLESWIAGNRDTFSNLQNEYGKRRMLADKATADAQKTAPVAKPTAQPGAAAASPVARAGAGLQAKDVRLPGVSEDSWVAVQMKRGRTSPHYRGVHGKYTGPDGTVIKYDTKDPGQIESELRGYFRKNFAQSEGLKTIKNELQKKELGVNEYGAVNPNVPVTRAQVNATRGMGEPGSDITKSKTGGTPIQKRDAGQPLNPNATPGTRGIPVRPIDTAQVSPVQAPESTSTSSTSTTSTSSYPVSIPSPQDMAAQVIGKGMSVIGNAVSKKIGEVGSSVAKSAVPAVISATGIKAPSGSGQPLVKPPAQSPFEKPVAAQAEGTVVGNPVDKSPPPAYTNVPNEPKSLDTLVTGTNKTPLSPDMKEYSGTESPGKGWTLVGKKGTAGQPAQNMYRRDDYQYDNGAGATQAQMNNSAAAQNAPVAKPNNWQAEADAAEKTAESDRFTTKIRGQMENDRKFQDQMEASRKGGPPPTYQQYVGGSKEALAEEENQRRIAGATPSSIPVQRVVPGQNQGAATAILKRRRG